jgi:quercetin dioxygenase-like cupin family protein
MTNALKTLGKYGLRNKQDMNIYPLEKFVKFSPNTHTKKVFFETEKIKAQVIGLEAGQQIPPCGMDFDVIFFVMEGEGEIILDGQSEVLKKSAWVFVPKEIETRSIRSETRMKVLAIQVRC